MSPRPKLPEPPPMPPAKQPGSPTRLNIKEDQLAQAASILASRLFEFKSLPQVASDHGVSRSTAQRRLRLARREGVPEMARNILIREALPAALAVVLDSLKSTDEALRTKSAWKLIDGLEAMKLPEEDRAAKKMGVSEDDSYEIWRERIKVTKGAIERAGDTLRRVDPVGAGARGAIEASSSQADAPDSPDIIEAVSFRPGPPDGPADEAEEDSPGDCTPDDLGRLDAGSEIDQRD